MLPTVADHLVARLGELGITEFFGVPGDFNFNICAAIEASDRARWIGCCNELNAGYAADGYARLKGFGAAVTTMGVGELSAINAIAGAYAEHVPVFKISGTPAKVVQEGRIPIHHTLGTGDYDVFQRIYASVTGAQAKLTAENAAAEIERLIGVAFTERRPVYINLPADVCRQRIAGYQPKFAPSVPDPTVIREVVDEITALLARARRPLIIVDAKVMRFGLRNEIRVFVEKSNLPVATLVMGKSVIDEQHPNFIGTYNGQLIAPETSRLVENADLLLAFGCLLNDMNSAAFTVNFDSAKTVDIQQNYVDVRRTRYDNVPMKELLVSLTETVEPHKESVPSVRPALGAPSGKDGSAKLTADHLYRRLQAFIQSGDTVMVDTGTLAMGAMGFRLPSDVEYHNQGFWMSVGYATPATLGAGLAAPHRRLLLFTGDGSHQLTAQEISNMLRYGLKPIIVLLNNNGYTIERYLCDDPETPFNDIAQWNYTKLPEAFGAQDAFVAQARTVGEFDQVLGRAAKSGKFVYIEIFLDRMDAPQLLHEVRAHRERLYGIKSE